MKVKGFRFSGISAGIKVKGKKDLALIYSDKPAAAAGVFTTSAVKAAPVILDRERVKRGLARAVIVNSGNANACTGAEGLDDARKMASTLADTLNISYEDVLVSSTGVIGQRLPVDKIADAVPELAAELGEDNIDHFAEAIMTTDAFPKVFSLSKDIDGKEIAVAGVAKGAGMIAPDMATMLAYIMTDVEIDPETLQHALEVSTEISFNSITVDGDMSTNDTVLALASGESGVRVDIGTPGFEIFLSTMKEVMVALARMIVKDGEGATKLVEIIVKGAESREEARRAALKIANSPLVKTAFYGEDANWGRIVAALGGADILMDESKLDIYFGDVKIVEGGLFAGKEAEEQATALMKKDELLLTVDINLGPHEVSIWTCDLTHDYIKINAEYRS